MAQRYKPMSLFGGLTDAVDWEELGRRVRQAAAEAAALGIDPSEQIREPTSCLTCASPVERKGNRWSEIPISLPYPAVREGIHAPVCASPVERKDK
ncbi:MAG: hypothetical protein V3W34_13150 [Phycisphaerae bacterium]